MSITPITARALTIIRDHDITMPSQFARFMWPDSIGWQSSVKCGHGSHRGGGMYLTGGAYLGKLVKRGLVKDFSYKPYDTWKRSFTLTVAGKAALEQHLGQKGTS